MRFWRQLVAALGRDTPAHRADDAAYWHERLEDEVHRTKEAWDLVHEREATILDYADLLGSLWLYVDWRYVTKKLTTPQRELFADAVDASLARDGEDEPFDDSPPFRVGRWWRDDA